MPRRSEIYVKPLTDNGSVIIQGFWLGRNIEFIYTEIEVPPSAGENWSQTAFEEGYDPNLEYAIKELRRVISSAQLISAAEYNKKMTLPTLAELRHAFFGGADDYRKSVFSNKVRGEWTSTYIQPRNPEKGEIIPEGYTPITIIHFDNQTDRIFEDPKTRLWQIECVPNHAFNDRYAPPNGWTLEYDKQTGFPIRTSRNREGAEEVFGGDASQFSVETEGVRAVLLDRYPYFGDNEPFCVNARLSPNTKFLTYAGRSCRR